MHVTKFEREKDDAQLHTFEEEEFARCWVRTVEDQTDKDGTGREEQRVFVFDVRCEISSVLPPDQASI